MRTNRLHLLSLATLIASALAAGCDPPATPDGAACDDGSCFTKYRCVAPLAKPEYANVALCDGVDITGPGSEGFRDTCQLDQRSADLFCHDECVKAALQNNLSQAQAEESCQLAAGLQLFDEGALAECYYDQYDVNKPLGYGPDAVCNGGDSPNTSPQGNGPVAPPLAGPFTAQLNLTASLDTGGGYASTAFSGEIRYSTYKCQAGSATCPVLVHSLSFDMIQPVSGRWVTAAGVASFSSSDLTVVLERPTSGLFSASSGALLLPQASMPLHVRGELFLDSATAPQPVDIHTHNAGNISGHVHSDGSVDVAGSFDLAPGKTVRFGTPDPQ